jgi:hypothetical protein
MRTKHLLVLGPLTVLPACPAAEEEECTPTISVSADPTTFASGESTALTIEVTDFHLEAPAERLPTDPSLRHGDEGYASACEGHYHVYLDDLESEPLLQGHESPVDVVVDAAAGPHELLVRLNGNDHKIVEPEVVDSVEISIQ